MYSEGEIIPGTAFYAVFNIESITFSIAGISDR